MSTTIPPVPQPPGSGTAPTPAGPAIVRLPWWVNVVLVLTLFAAGTAASNAVDAANQARTAANQAGNTMPVGGSADPEVAAMCRLLGVLAVKQGVDLSVAFGEKDPTTNCHTVAQEAATPTPGP